MPYAVRDQVHHLAQGEELAALAASDADAFGVKLADLLADVDGLERAAAAQARTMKPPELLARWRSARVRTLAAIRAIPADARIRWVTGDMSRSSFATARLMETWAHGQDIYDGLGRARPPTTRLRHVADLGVRTRPFSYRNRGLEPPAADVRVDLTGSEGERWSWGADDAVDRISGTAEDFCLVVTRRRHVDDTTLTVQGRLAAEWLAIAQVFAGPPTEGRRPGQFARLGT